MLLVACSREIWLMTLLFDFDIQIKHKPGELLILADALSPQFCKLVLLYVGLLHRNLTYSSLCDGQELQRGICSRHTSQQVKPGKEIYWLLLVEKPHLFLTNTLRYLHIYIQHLAQQLSSPATVRNYISVAKWWIATRGGDTTASSSHEVAAVIRGITRLSNHIPRQTQYLYPRDIRHICDYLARTGQQGWL